MGSLLVRSQCQRKIMFFIAALTPHARHYRCATHEAQRHHTLVGALVNPSRYDGRECSRCKWCACWVVSMGYAYYRSRGAIPRWKIFRAPGPLYDHVEDPRQALKDQLRTDIVSNQPDGTITLYAKTWAVRGEYPQGKKLPTDWRVQSGDRHDHPNDRTGSRSNRTPL